MRHQPKSEPEPATTALVLRSIWHWDLWGAFAIGLVVGLGWTWTEYEPKWGWIAPVIGLSVTMAGLAWNQWNALRSKLQGSEYGELLRLIDRSETEVRLPYFITLFVSLASAFWSTLTAISVEAANNRPVEAVLLGVTGWLASWSGLGVWSLAIHSARHDKTMAQIEAMREETEATQRRHEAERGGGVTSEPKEIEEETR